MGTLTLDKKSKIKTPQVNTKTEEEFVDEFIEYVEYNYKSVLDSTNTDDEVIYLMMGSLGRLADLFKLGTAAEHEIIKQCKSIAAAALAISIPTNFIESDEVSPSVAHLSKNNEVTGDKKKKSGEIERKTTGDVKFFVYKQHSHGMTLRLDSWRMENQLDFASWSFGGYDKNGRPLICMINEQGELEAFIVCADEATKELLISYLSIAYPVD